MISEFISLSPGLPAVSSILDEAALPSDESSAWLRKTRWDYYELHSQQFSRRSLLETHFNKEKRK